ncbi:hypothetical protein F7725_014280 [Dissostichus mawsoni]|uniref:VWFD domain-containing protein n=1 Tax=Dissostichus mawsoni TaxID=36200 RepID=A0A7J5YVH2_DISMA|nr:hypothetical protein F7725_014280 [Dissostichus mawsoni]
MYFQAGYDTINSAHHFSIPGSFSNNGSSSYLDFRQNSNVNVAGRWAFRTDHGSRGCTFNGQTVQQGDSFWSDRSCAQKCTCTSTGLQCHSQPCSFSQVCRPTAFQFSCQTVRKGRCTISGDPHYYTFDNKVFHFQGTCTYVLSEQCGRGLPYYRVEGKNEHRGSTRVAWTRLVKVHVYNDTIELVKGRRGMAKVNGNFAATPISLSNGTVQVYESGFSVIISTVFGLEVSYDTNSYVRDDFRTRQGELVSSDVVFANSWKASGDDEPACGSRCGGLDCARCTAAQTALYSNPAHCGILTSTSGPFAACHQQLHPQNYLESCVQDLCIGGGYQPILCQALNVYASQCQQNGVQLPSWRRQGFCEIPCPSNSHFVSQGTGCPDTCVNPNSTQNCPLPVQESCICNAGYILSAGVCVPHAQCGCSFEGRYYRSGETVILDEDCGRQCRCSYGSMTCQSHGCGPLESCRVEEGERGCTPDSYGTCWTRGPGSYQTFDGLTYQYPGACRLTLAKVDGQQIRLPYSSASNRIQIYHSSIHSIIIRTAFGVNVQTVWPHLVRVTAPGIYNGSLGGLCGNFNGHQHDEFRTPNGVQVDTSQDFGDSWRDGSLAAHCVESNHNNSRTNSSHSSLTRWAICQCWAMVDPMQHVDACVEITRASIDPEAALCEFLRDYAIMCQQKGVALGNWRISTHCAQNCPPNSHYELCDSSCPSACPSLSFPFACDTVCQEGCQCNDGLVLNGNQCVPPTSCGCYHEGRYRQGGERFWDSEECQSSCVCNGTTGAVQCVPNSCSPEESCRVVEGEFGCHPNPHGTCYASGDPHYLTFDGKAFDFQGTCRYVLAKPCNETEELHQFSVEARNEPWRGLQVSITAEVFVNVWGYRVQMASGSQGLDCPANTHYELCGTDCGHTCASNIDATCEQVCSEGCFCDEGFVRSGTRCVPVESCGCQYNGFYYNADESFWTEGCSQRCECHAPNDLRCSAVSCTPTQDCTIRHGELACFDAMSTCTVWGDPHYKTFDGALAHFQGTCSYIVTESVSDRTDDTGFQVVATNNHRGNNHVSFVSEVDIYLTNQPESVNITIGPSERVKINGIEVTLPSTAGTLAHIQRQGHFIEVNAMDLTVQFDGRSTLLVRVNNNHENRVTGMCGNLNSDSSDDKVLPNGTLAQNDNQFGQSWKSPKSQPGCGSTDRGTGGGDGLNDCTFRGEYSELCSVITNTSGPFSACHLHSDPQPFYTSCVYDLCLYTPANGMLCSAIAAYERTCSVLELNIPEWRSALH